VSKNPQLCAHWRVPYFSPHVFDVILNIRRCTPWCVVTPRRGLARAVVLRTGSHPCVDVILNKAYSPGSTPCAVVLVRIPSIIVHGHWLVFSLCPQQTIR
jgi:hypothetical protein